LVLKDRLVETCVAILRLISDKSMSINKIILQTSSDRSHVIDAIKTLEKAKLVKRRPSKTRKQMEFLELKQMGEELANFIKSIEWFRRSFHSLAESIDKNFDSKEFGVMKKESLRMAGEERNTMITKRSKDYLMSEKRLKNKQKAKDWTDTEIYSHNLWFEEADDFQMYSAKAFIAGLFSKYISLSLKHGSNEVSRAILTKIVMDALNQHLTYTYKLFRRGSDKLFSDSEDKNYSDELTNGHITYIFSLNSEIRSYLEDFSEEETVYYNLRSTPPTFNFVPKINNRFLVNEVENVMKSIASMCEYDVEWGVDDSREGNGKNSKLRNQ
jgi:DNA-binding MarR family transcriptional regulator